MKYYMPGGQVEAGGAPLDWLRSNSVFVGASEILSRRLTVPNSMVPLI
jgi:hypothetical protein